MKSSDTSTASETPILVRLEKMATFIENNISKPEMYAANAGELEVGLLNSLNMWAIITDSSLSVRDLWREEIEKAYPNSERGYSTVSLARPSEEFKGSVHIPRTECWELLTEYQKFRILRPIIIKHFKVIWGKLKHTA